MTELRGANLILPVLLLVHLSACTGCGSIIGNRYPDQFPPVYKGVACDFEMISRSTSGREGAWMLGFMVLDIPASLVVGTVLLPINLVQLWFACHRAVGTSDPAEHQQSNVEQGGA